MSRSVPLGEAECVWGQLQARVSRGSHLNSHQASATSHVQDEGLGRWDGQCLCETADGEVGGAVLQGGHILGTES